MAEIGSINWLAVAGAALAYYVLGALWFAPFAFGPVWDEAIGFDRPADWKPSPMYYVVPLLGCISVTVVAAILIAALRLTSPLEAASLGLLLGAGVGGAVSMVNAVTPRMEEPLRYGAVTGSYHALGSSLAAAVLVLLN